MPVNTDKYNYFIKEYLGYKFIVIKYVPFGTILTTNMRQVVNEIIAIHNLDVSKYMIIYKDSATTWDAYNYQQDAVILLQYDSDKWQDAALLYISSCLIKPNEYATPQNA